jgi:hypothetical protein
MSIEACKWCTLQYTKRVGNINLCAKHYRFWQMRSTAKQYGKSVPTYQTLQNLTNSLVDMKCPHCQIAMTWLRIKGQAGRVISLQHDRDGTIRLLCLSCNSRHSVCSDDTYYEIPPTLYHCIGCDKWKDRSEFRTRRRGNGIRRESYCKPCDNRKRRERAYWR